MSKNWNRRCSIVVSDCDGNGIDVSDLRVLFDVRQPDITKPALCTIKIFNLSSETENKIYRGEFTQVQIDVGYQNNIGTIFKGDIRYSYTGRESSTDTYIVIQAADGDKAFNYSTVNTTLAAGYTVADIKNCIMQGLSDTK